MMFSDRVPLANTPVTRRIAAEHNNRLGAVYSALYAFWVARDAVVANAAVHGHRRDAYSIILFNHEVDICTDNDLTSTPDELLTESLGYLARGATNYTLALDESQAVMERNWSPERLVSI